MSKKRGARVMNDQGSESEITVLRSLIDDAKSFRRQEVKVKVDASYDSIKIGEFLATSPAKGRRAKTTTGMHPNLFGGGPVPRSLISQRVKIPPVLFTRNLSFKKKA